MEKIEVLADVISALHETYLWTYDTDMNLIGTNCPNPSGIEAILGEDHLEDLRKIAEEHRKPTIIPGSFHLSWIVVSKKKGSTIENIHTLGPFFIDSYPETTIRQELVEQNASLQYKYRVLELLNAVPVISLSKVIEYTLMMHYAVTGEKINIYDLHYQQIPVSEEEFKEHETKVHGTYEAEKEMLRMVREGDTRLMDYLKKMSRNLVVGKLANDDSEPLRQLKNTVLVSIVLFSRAAIEGGLYPDTAMTLTDFYFQAIEAASSFQEIADITMTMESDFVNRVHKIRTDNYSKVVRTMIDYVDLHLEDDIFIRNIASELGYSDYYLTKLFKKETGMTFKEYIRDKRLEKASYLLENFGMSVNDVSDRLKFSSTSYFIDCYKKKYGSTPGKNK